MLPLLLACTGAPAADTGAPDTAADTDTEGSDTAAQSDLDAARATWDAAALDAYTYVLQWQCYACEGEVGGPARIEVAGDAVVAATYVDSGAPATAAFDARTIDGLFDFLQAALDAGADQLTVTYDATRGYPAQAYVDYDVAADDDERGFVASELAPR
jgi:hypothetical protein